MRVPIFVLAVGLFLTFRFFAKVDAAKNISTEIVGVQFSVPNFQTIVIKPAIQITNGLPSGIDINAVQGDITYKNIPIGAFNLNTPFTIPANGKTVAIPEITAGESPVAIELAALALINKVPASSLKLRAQALSGGIWYPFTKNLV